MLALVQAVREGNVEQVEKLLNEVNDINALRDNKGWALLHHAAASGQEAAARLLLEKGADINVKIKGTGSTPLISAVLGKKKEIALFLISTGANVSIRDNWGSTAIDWAKELWCDEEVIEALKKASVNAKNNNSNLSDCADKKDDIEKTETLPESKDKVNMQDEFDRTSLHQDIEENNLMEGSALSGINPSETAKSDEVSLDSDSEDNCEETANILQEKKQKELNTNELLNQNNSNLSGCADKKDDIEKTETLPESKDKVNMQDEFDRTSLHQDIEKNNLMEVSALSGINPSETANSEEESLDSGSDDSYSGKVSLYVDSDDSDEETTDTLKENEQNELSTNKFLNWTHDWKVIEAIKKASVNAKNNNSNPLDCADKKDDIEKIEILTKSQDEFNRISLPKDSEENTLSGIKPSKDAKSNEELLDSDSEVSCEETTNTLKKNEQNELNMKNLLNQKAVEEDTLLSKETENGNNISSSKSISKKTKSMAIKLVLALTITAVGVVGIANPKNFMGTNNSNLRLGLSATAVMLGLFVLVLVSYIDCRKLENKQSGKISGDSSVSTNLSDNNVESAEHQNGI